MCFPLLSFQLSDIHMILSDDGTPDFQEVTLEICSKSQLMEFQGFQDFQLVYQHGLDPKLLLSFFRL